MLDIFFVNGPFLKGFSRESRSPAVTKSGTLYYPAWLAYAAGFAEESGHKVTLLDAVADDLSFTETVEAISKLSPEIVVIGTSTPSIDADADLASALKQRMPSAWVVLVGTHASALARECLVSYPAVDIVARREYDLTIVDLLKAKKGLIGLSDVLGITYRSGQDIFETLDRPYIQDLDQIPFASKVYKKYLHIKNYYYGHVKWPMISIFTSRGCNAKCTYCLYPQTMFGEFRSRSPKNIAQEFVWIKENLPEVKEVLIDDDTLTMFPEHAKEVSAELIKVGNKIPWTCEVRANLDFETMKAMKLAGCRLVVVGFESIHQDVLNKVKKGTKQSNVEKFVEDARDANMKIHACFMAGNPGDTLPKLQSTLDWALKNKFDTAQFFPLQVYPGTEAYGKEQAAGRVKKQKYRMWITETGMHNMTIQSNDEGLTEKDVLDFCDYARRKFYLRPSYIFRKSLDVILDPVEFKKNVKGFINIRKHLFKNVSSQI